MYITRFYIALRLTLQLFRAAYFKMDLHGSELRNRNNKIYKHDRDDIIAVFIGVIPMHASSGVIQIYSTWFKFFGRAIKGKIPRTHLLTRAAD